MKESCLVLSLLVLSLGMVSAFNFQISDQGTSVIDANGDLQDGDLVVSIYDEAKVGNLIYYEIFDDSIFEGSWNVMLGENKNLSLEYGKAYYKDYFVMGEDVSFDGENRQLFYSPLGVIGGEDLDEDFYVNTSGNLSTSGVGSFGSLVLGNSSINSWDDLGSGGGGGLVSAINLTTGTYLGSLSYNSYVGYKAGDAICDAEYSGSHFCSEEEIATWQGKTIDNEAAWVIGGSKYAGEVLVNDCNGWTHDVADNYLGSYWYFNSTTGGVGRIVHCENELPLACCSY